MSKLAIRLLAETVRSLGFASIGPAYMGIGTVFTNPIRMIFVQNLTDQTLMFSFDGVNDHFPLPTNGFLLLDITSNKTIVDGFFIGENTRIYVREIGNPISGTVWVTAFFGSTT